MNFVAVDVETANSSRASICSIGVASFSDGKLVDEFYTLLNPQTDFYSHNIQRKKLNKHHYFLLHTLI